MSRASVPAIETASLEAQLSALPGLDRLRSLTPSFAEATPETISAILTEASLFAADRLEAVNVSGERSLPHVDDGRVVLADIHREVWHDYASSGWMTLDLSASHGGQALPLVLAIAAQEIFDRHCAAFGMLPVPVRSAARLLEAFATDTLRDEWLPRLMFGVWGATICISEVGAGSDAGRIRTRALRQEDGSWTISGEKHWISFGSHNLTDRIGHCLLARTDGAKGLTLFLVPDRIDGVANGVLMRRLEHKLGLHSSPTCAIGFEEAKGYLLGEEGRGLAQMFVMIANMRLAVGAMGVGMAGAAADVALAYAQQRRQGGEDAEPVTIIEHADVQRLLVTMQADVELARGLVYAAAVETDLGRVESDPNLRRESGVLAQWLLPIVKTLGGDVAFATSSQAMQVLGGAGYTNDWPIEQFLRDARVLPIFEGTTGMQAIDLVHRRLWRDQGIGLTVFLRRFEAAIESAADMEEQGARQAAASTFALLSDVAEHFRQLADDPREAEAGATAFLSLATDAALSWTALRLALLSGEDAAQGRLRALALSALPRLASQAAWHAAEARAGTRPLQAVKTLA